MEILINTANILYLLSCFVRDMLKLRVLTVVAASCLIAYFYFRPEPIMTVVYWNLFFVAQNAYWIVQLVAGRRKRGSVTSAGTGVQRRTLNPAPAGVLERRQPLPDLLQASEIEVTHQSGIFVRSASHDVSPRIDNHRLTEAGATGVVATELGGRDDVALVLDGTGAQKRFPMNLSGGNRKSRGHEEHFRAGKRVRAIKLGKPKVIADAQPHDVAQETRGDDVLARLDIARLLKGMLFIDVDVEQMHLVVASHQLAVGIENQAGIADLGGVRGLERNATTHDGHVVFGGEISQALDAGTAVQVLGHLNLVTLAPDKRKVLGERKKFRSAFHCLFHERVRPNEVRVPIPGGAHLDGGNAQDVSVRSHRLSLLYSGAAYINPAGLGRSGEPPLNDLDGSARLCR